MAPLLIFVTTLVAVVVSKQAAQTYLIREASQLTGAQSADLIRSLLSNAHSHSSGIFATVIAFITLLFGASGVFGELRDAMNTIWGDQSSTSSSWRGMIFQRLFSFAMVLSVGFLLLVSLALSTVLMFVGKHFVHAFPVPSELLEAANFVVSFAVITFLFALIFKFVPSTRISWRDALIGAIWTALLFTIGKFLLGLYLAKASVGSTYGAAGSVVALIVWVYYSAQIFFFGAEFTKVYSDDRKKRQQGTSQAVPQPSKALRAGA